MKILEEIGLTKGDIKVYLALLDSGSCTTGEIVKHARVSKSKVYEMLDRLIQKGLVSQVMKSKIKYFQASDPENILDYVKKEREKFEEKEAELKKLLPKLRSRQKQAVKENVAMYSGVKGIKTIYQELLSEMKKGEEYYAIAIEPNAYKDFELFIHNYHLKRAEKGVHVKLLAHESLFRDVSRSIGKTKFMKIRYFKSSIPAATLIYKDKVATFSWSDNPTGVVIKSSTISSRYNQFFREIWNRNK